MYPWSSAANAKVTNRSWAQAAGYSQVYLESMPELKQALKVYAKFGFSYLKGPMGNSGHTGCSLWMLKSLAG